MFNEDNTGYVNFPNERNKNITLIDSGKTLVYIVAFDYDKNSKFSNVNLFLPGIFVSDDVVARPESSIKSITLDELIDSQVEQEKYDMMYFPNMNTDDSWRRLMSMNLVSVICVGWSNNSYEYNNKISFWNASYTELTNEGTKLYYSIKKLHNTKEVRILTFNIN